MKIRLPQLRESRGGKSPGLAYDCDLAARIRQGDHAALKQLIERHTGRVQGYLSRRLGHGHDEKIARMLAATFSIALRRLGPYAKGTASTPMDLWLIRIAERKLGRGTTDDQRPTTVPKGKPDDQRSTDLERLRAALNTIPGRHSFVLALALFEQMPDTAISQTLGVSPAGAMRRLRAALRRVEKALEQHGEAR